MSIKLIILELLISILIAFITYKIAGENYNSTSYIGGAIGVGILMIISESFK